jgi:hypothetical protein
VEPRLTGATLDRLLAGVDAADEAYRQGWPGFPATRQPVQVLYVPADRVTPDLARSVGQEALGLLDRHAGDVRSFGAATGITDEALAADVRARVVDKLQREPIEDLRVDVEDGYLGRDESTEASDVVAAARSLAAMVVDASAPPFVGIRVKAFTDGLARRSVVTLDRFLGALLAELGSLPDGFVVTFPKIVSVEHVRAFVDVLDHLEDAYGLPHGRLRFEVQIETTPSVLGPDGRIVLRTIREAGQGRICAAHLGVYDYTAGLGLAPGEQRPEHPACDFVRHLLQVTFAGTEIRLSDGSCNAIPRDDTSAELHRVWGRHAAAVRHSLGHGYVQGWDLHVSHLVSRYAVVFADLLQDLDAILDRLLRWYGGAPDGAPSGSQGGGLMDEPATIRRLEAHVQRAVDSAAIGTATVHRRTGRTFEPRPVRELTTAAGDG